jgi:hypothetical protein
MPVVYTADDRESWLMSAVVPDWGFFLVYNTIMEGARGTAIPEEVMQGEACYWEENAFGRYLDPVALQGMDALPPKVFPVVLHAHNCCRFGGGRVDVQATEETRIRLLNWIELACSRSLVIMKGYQKKEIAGVLRFLDINGEDKMEESGIRGVTFYNACKVVSTRQLGVEESTASLGAQWADVDLYEESSTLRSSVFVEAATLFILDSVHRLLQAHRVPEAELDCIGISEMEEEEEEEEEDQEKGDRNGEEKEKDKEKIEEVQERQSPSFPEAQGAENFFLNQSAEPSCSAANLSAVERTRKKIKELEPFSDVVFVLGRDDDGTIIIPASKSAEGGDTKVEDRRPRIPGHTAFFIAASSWFRFMLSRKMKEARTEFDRGNHIITGGSVCIQPDIYLEDVNRSMFEIMQLWVYGAGSEAVVDYVGQSGLGDLIELCQGFHLTKLMEVCGKRLLSLKMSKTHIFDFLSYSHEKGYEEEMEASLQQVFRELLQRCTKFVASDFKYFVLSPLPTAYIISKLQDEGQLGDGLDWMPFEVIESTLQQVDQRLPYRTEPLKLLLVLRWCSILPDRYQHCLKLLSLIDFELFCPVFLLRFIRMLSLTQPCVRSSSFSSYSKSITRCSSSSSSHNSASKKIEPTGLPAKYCDICVPCPEKLVAQIENELERQAQLGSEVGLGMRQAKSLRLRRHVKLFTGVCSTGLECRMGNELFRRDQVLTWDEAPSNIPLCCFLDMFYDHLVVYYAMQKAHPSSSSLSSAPKKGCRTGERKRKKKPGEAERLRKKGRKKRTKQQQQAVEECAQLLLDEHIENMSADDGVLDWE